MEECILCRVFVSSYMSQVRWTYTVSGAEATDYRLEDGHRSVYLQWNTVHDLHGIVMMSDVC